MSNFILSCWSCGHNSEFLPPLGRGEICLNCRRDAKCCLNCRFYDRDINGECSETQAELVKDKEKSNFCEWFVSRGGSRQSIQRDSENPLDQLFGGQTNVKVKSKLEEEMEAFFNKKN